jgi:predicted nucleotidyltransferase
MQKERINKLKPAMPELRQKYPIGSMAVFGPVLRGDVDNSSEMDRLVDFASADFCLFMQLADELEKIVNRKVDLITIRSLKERHWNYLKDKLVYV